MVSSRVGFHSTVCIGSWGAIPVVVAPPLGPPLGAAITSNGVMVFPTWESDVAAYLTSMESDWL